MQQFDWLFSVGMRFAVFAGMARRRIELTTIFKPLTYCAALVLFLWFVSSGLRPGIEILLFSLLFSSLIALVTFLFHRTRINSAIRHRKNRIRKWMPQN